MIVPGRSSHLFGGKDVGSFGSDAAQLLHNYSGYSGYRFPPEIIQHAIWFYIRFTLSFRDVEDLLAEREIMFSYETVRRWMNHIGPMVAADLRKRRPKHDLNMTYPGPRKMIEQTTQTRLGRNIEHEGPESKARSNHVAQKPDTLVRLGQRLRLTPEEWKAWMVTTISGVCRVGQAVTADSLTIGSLLKGAMVSSVM